MLAFQSSRVQKSPNIISNPESVTPYTFYSTKMFIILSAPRTVQNKTKKYLFFHWNVNEKLKEGAYYLITTTKFLSCTFFTDFSSSATWPMAWGPKWPPINKHQKAIKILAPWVADLTSPHQSGLVHHHWGMMAMSQLGPRLGRRGGGVGWAKLGGGGEEGVIPEQHKKNS